MLDKFEKQRLAPNDTNARSQSQAKLHVLQTRCVRSSIAQTPEGIAFAFPLTKFQLAGFLPSIKGNAQWVGPRVYPRPNFSKKLIRLASSPIGSPQFELYSQPLVRTPRFTSMSVNGLSECQF
jgi:hypothetical protein